MGFSVVVFIRNAPERMGATMLKNAKQVTITEEAKRALRVCKAEMTIKSGESTSYSDVVIRLYDFWKERGEHGN